MMCKEAARLSTTLAFANHAVFGRCGRRGHGILCEPWLKLTPCLQCLRPTGCHAVQPRGPGECGVSGRAQAPGRGSTPALRRSGATLRNLSHHTYITLSSLTLKGNTHRQVCSPSPPPHTHQYNVARDKTSDIPTPSAGFAGRSPSRPPPSQATGQ